MDTVPKTIQCTYEFYGCFWHGCERCFASQIDRLSDKQDTLFIRRENTLAKEVKD